MSSDIEKDNLRKLNGLVKKKKLISIGTIDPAKTRQMLNKNDRVVYTHKRERGDYILYVEKSNKKDIWYE